MKNSYYLRYYNPRLSGYVYRSRRPCGKTNCKCARDNKHWHPYYYHQYVVRSSNGKLKNRWEYVPKSKVRSLRQRIRRYKAKDKLRKARYNFFISEATHLENNPFDTDAWNQLRQEIPQPAKLAVTLLQQIAVMRCLLNLADAIPNYFDKKIAAEEKLLATECQVAIDLLNDLSYDLWEY